MATNDDAGGSAARDDAIRTVTPIESPPALSAGSRRPLRGIVSYGHEHQPAEGSIPWLDELVTVLQPLVREGLITLWHDRKLEDGVVWNDAIEQRFREANFAILLVTPKFVASKYIFEHELPILLDRRQRESLTLYLLVIEPADLECVYRYPDSKAGPNQIRLSALQAVNDPEKPLSSLQKAEWQGILSDVGAKLRALATESNTGRTDALDQVDDQEHQARPAFGWRRSGISRRARPRHGDDIRDAYLTHLGEHVDRLLRASIHKVRFMDLGLEDTPEAAHLPWMCASPSDPGRVFDTVHSAFDAYDRRLLLLGAPGAGKTTALLHLARDLVVQASEDEAAPVPLLVNLSEFSFKRASTPLLRSRGAVPSSPARDRSFEEWLVRKLDERTRAGVRKVRQWLAEGKVASLLDGLDEVNDQRRADLVVLLNETYLADYPLASVVVCSRIEEYQPLKDGPGTKLQLSRAVTLQPLSEAGITKYLEAAHAPGLKEAFVKDPALMQLARNPLTLSMMTLAYGDGRSSPIEAGASILDQRHQLMAAYVESMLQRSERRKRNVPFNADKNLEVPVSEYQYSPADVDRYLGWLAVRMSVRMRTACARDALYALLSAGADTSRPRQDPGALAASLGVASCITLLPLAVLAVAREPERWYVPGGMLVGAGLASGVMAFLEGAKPPARGRLLLSVSRFAAPVIFLVFSEGALSQGIAASLHGRIPAGSAGVMTIAALAASIASAGFALQRDRRAIWPIGAALVAAGSCGIAVWLGVHLRPDLVFALGLAASQVVAFGVIGSDEDGWRGSMAAVVISVILTATAFASAMIPGLAYWQLPTCAAWVAVPFGMGAPDVGLAFALSMTVGAIFGGTQGAVVGTAVGGLLIAGWTAAEQSSNAPTPLQPICIRAKALGSWLSESLVRRLLSPILLRALAVSRTLPVRSARFFEFCEDALLLKPAPVELEFVHRRLRDYFALRELLPQLRGATGKQRLELIDALGFQGAAAIDALADTAREGDPQERAAAVTAISRIASPEVVKVLERALSDDALVVRRAAVLGLTNVLRKDAERLLRSAADVDDPNLQDAVIAAAISGRHSPILAHALTRWGAERDVIRAFAGRLGALEDKLSTWSLGMAELPQGAGETFVDLLSDPSPTMRRGALRALAIWPVFLDADRVATLALTDDRAEVRAEACTALGAAKRGNKALSSALGDRSEAVRVEAAKALGNLGTEALEPLVGALGDARPGVRVAACEALGTVGAKDAVERLVPLLGDRVEEVRFSAAMALADLGDHRASEQLRLAARKDALAIPAISALGRLRDRTAVKDLIRRLADPAEYIRDTAAEALGAIGDPQAILPLVKVLSDRSERVRRSAAFALAKLKAPQAADPLIKLLRAPEEWTRWLAVQALGEMGTDRAVEGLVGILDGPDDRTRRSARLALKSIGTPEALEAVARARLEE